MTHHFASAARNGPPSCWFSLWYNQPREVNGALDVTLSSISDWQSMLASRSTICLPVGSTGKSILWNVICDDQLNAAHRLEPSTSNSQQTCDNAKPFLQCSTWEKHHEPGIAGPELRSQSSTGTKAFAQGLTHLMHFPVGAQFNAWSLVQASLWAAPKNSWQSQCYTPV